MSAGAVLRLTGHEIAAIGRQGVPALQTPLFFLVLVALFPLALGPDRAGLQEEAGALLMIAALLAGLLSHIGVKDRDTPEYRAARNARFMIARGSTFSKRSPRWVMAGELVETNRTADEIRQQLHDEFGIVHTTLEWRDPDHPAAGCHNDYEVELFRHPDP